MARKGEKVEIHLHKTGTLKREVKNAALPDNLVDKIKEFGYLSFSDDDHRLLSLSTEVEPVIIMWNAETNPINIMSYLSLNQNVNCLEVMFCPTNPNLISVCGKDNFRLLKY